MYHLLYLQGRDVMKARSGNTPIWNLRMEKSLWRRFGRAVAKNGANRTAVVRQFVLWYISEPGASLPNRPETPTPEIPEDSK